MANTENKMQFFSDLEKNRKYPKDTLTAKDTTYEEIKNWKIQTELSFDDFNDCDSGVVYEQETRENKKRAQKNIP